MKHSSTIHRLHVSIRDVSEISITTQNTHLDTHVNINDQNVPVSKTPARTNDTHTHLNQHPLAIN